MYPQECFAYYKRPFWPVLCLKRIGLPCCTFVTTIVTCALQIILLSNYSATYNFSTCRHHLAENHLSFPSAPRWVRHSYLSKRATIDPLYLWVIRLLIDLYFFSDIWVLFGQLGLFILQWEEVLCDGFDLTVLDPTNRRGNDTYVSLPLRITRCGLFLHK